MELINANNLQKSKEREDKIREITGALMFAIIEANREGKREIQCHCIRLDDTRVEWDAIHTYPEIKETFEQHGYSFRTTTEYVFGGRIVQKDYVSW